jgi:hypothetical protein
LPLHELGELLDHAHRLMAHLSVVRMTLAQRAAALPSQPSSEALQAAEASLQRSLALEEAAPAEPPVEPARALPEEAPAQDPLPWLQRRLQVTTHDGYRVGLAARTLLGKVRG